MKQKPYSNSIKHLWLTSILTTVFFPKISGATDMTVVNELLKKGRGAIVCKTTYGGNFDNALNSEFTQIGPMNFSIRSIVQINPSSPAAPIVCVNLEPK